ncbi:hypothetical protein PYW08_016871 [Mythimna loreyi]|nr:hypothetical protein PYW08_016871 [Mythimna loreyi]
MDIHFTAEELAFRDQVRSFLNNKLPQDLADKVRLGKPLSKDDHLRWQAIQNAQGWYATHWPVAFGGTGWGAVEKHIYEEECALQQDHYLPRILNGEDWWCQGYSEPGAGSDLASLKTRAVREGDVYIVNGQKTWTTLGQHANMIFCLVPVQNLVGEENHGWTCAKYLLTYERTGLAGIGASKAALAHLKHMPASR